MSSEERRAPGAARVPFEGLVEVGGAEVPSFEAHGVDVSADGMHVRTAFLPEIGQRVTCRFETSRGQSVVVAGEVVWSRPADAGGEFGIRFTEVDPDSVALIRGLCAGVDPGSATSQPGAKVRLYIDGLASPMRARVREAQPSAVTVGSELGFLKVGRPLELEDAQSGNKRPASIDHVDVALDAGSLVPQLIVTLKYTDHGQGADPRGDDTAPTRRRGRGSLASFASFEDASSRMKGIMARRAAGLGPALERWGRAARETLGHAWTRRQADDDSTPRRTTAPPPGGGLHTNGRRVVRGDAAMMSSEYELPRNRFPRRAAISAAVMIAAIAGALVLKKTHHEGSTSAGTADVAPAASASAGAQAGATLLADAGAAVASESSAASAAPGADAGLDDPRTADHAKSDAPKVAPFGNGPVHHGVLLRLHMDGAIASIEGAPQPLGFDVKLPGRKSLEPAAPLAARDSRIASIKVDNDPTGAELSVVFRDGVPNYQVSARGDTLVIALAPAGPVETTADRGEAHGKGDAGAKHGHHAHRRTRHHAPAKAAVRRRPDTAPER